MDSQYLETASTVSVLEGPAASADGAESPDPIRLAPDDPRTIGRFAVRAKIGQGGMGVVYEAEDPQLGRRVAIKLVRADRRGDGARHDRILREAQALAQLSHPNVVQIYEVGSHDGGVFLAMEHVRGQALSSWHRAAPKDHRRRLAVYRDAGRGLAAAHAKGIVHRDFKPGNVIIGEDGRVRVLDFGIARAMTDDPATVGQALRESSPALSARLTATGALLGTPAFMSPEQFEGEETDARSDQFSFCVSLYEALYGERPFAGSTVKELTAAVLRGELRPAPRGTRIPPWLRKVVVRGLALEPEDRWPSMDALLQQLARDPVRTRRRVAFAALLVVAIVGVTYWATRQRPASTTCTGAARSFAEVWNPARRAAVRDALLATSAPYAGTTWDTVQAAIGDYGERWAATHTETCRAHERLELSAALLDDSMRCLERRKVGLRALIDVLASADGTVVEKASEAVASLESPLLCADRRFLDLQVEPPTSPDTERVVAGLRDELDEVRSLELAGRYQRAQDRAEAVVARARGLKYPPILAEALFQYGRVQERLERGQDASEAVYEAVNLAEAHRHDILASDAWSLLTLITARVTEQMERSRWSAERATSALTRIGADDRRRATLAHAIGLRYLNEKSYGEARAAFQDSLERLRKGAGLDQMAAARVLMNLASTEADSGDRESALATYRRALELVSAAAGPEHPLAADILGNIGRVEIQRGNPSAARTALQRVLAIQTEVYPADSPRLATTLLLLAQAEELLGAYSTALAHVEQAASIHKQVLRADHPRHAQLLTLIGVLHYRREDYPAALAAYEQALAIWTAARRPDHVDTLTASSNVAEVLVKLGEHERAMARSRDVLAGFERVLGPSDVRCAFPLKTMGLAHLAQNRPRRAVPVLERALALLLASGDNPPEIADVRWALARALGLGAGDRDRAVTLARAALRFFETTDGGASESGDIATWIARYAPR